MLEEEGAAAAAAPVPASPESMLSTPPSTDAAAASEDALLVEVYPLYFGSEAYGCALGSITTSTACQSEGVPILPLLPPLMVLDGEGAV